MSHLFVIDAHKNKIIFIKLGDPNYWKPTYNNMEMIREISDSERLSKEEISKLLIVSDVKEFPKILSEEEYVFIVYSEYELTNKDKEFWINMIEGAKGDDSMKVFMCASLDIKRIKKSLLPFL